MTWRMAVSTRSSLKQLEGKYIKEYVEICRDPNDPDSDEERPAYAAWGRLYQKVMRERREPALHRLNATTESELRHLLLFSANVPSSAGNGNRQAPSVETLCDRIGQLEEQCTSLRQQLDEQQRRGDDLEARCRRLETWEEWWWRWSRWWR